MKCNYCNKEAEWVANSKIYGKRYGKSYMIWWCRDCDAYVGCHNNTLEPKGTLANKELRTKRIEAKNLFIEKKLGGEWNGRKSKPKAYMWLQDKMDLSPDEAHFGKFNIEQCNKIIGLLTP